MKTRRLLLALLAFGTTEALLERTAAATELTAAYLGEFLLHPGAVVGAEAPLRTTAWGARRGQVLAAGHLGGYLHVRNHAGAMIDADVGYRFTFGSGIFVDAFAGLGYLHTFVAGPVYTVADGNVERELDLGRPAFMPTASIGTGWQLTDLAPFVRVQAFGQYPFNDHLLPHFALLLGARFNVPRRSP